MRWPSKGTAEAYEEHCMGQRSALPFSSLSSASRNAVRCDGHRRALHVPMKSTAEANAVHCVFYRSPVRETLRCALRAFTPLFPRPFGEEQKRRDRILDAIPYDTLGVVSDYSATTAAVSAAAVSAAALSATTVSSTALSIAQESLSAQQPCSVLLPQDAKDTATMAANTNANFFISLCF